MKLKRLSNIFAQLVTNLFQMARLEMLFLSENIEYLECVKIVKTLYLKEVVIMTEITEGLGINFLSVAFLAMMLVICFWRMMK